MHERDIIRYALFLGRLCPVCYSMYAYERDIIRYALFMSDFISCVRVLSLICISVYWWCKHEVIAVIVA